MGTFQNTFSIAFGTRGKMITFDALAPSSLILEVLSDTSIKLDWTINSSNRDGHKIERSTDGVNYSVIDTVLAATSTYTDTTGTAGTLYYYRVRAYKGSSYSSYSDAVSARTFGSQLGTIISDNFARASLGSDWVEYTPTTDVALDGSKLIWSHTSGASTWAEYVVYKNVMTIERWECEIIFKPSIKTGYSAGMAIRWESVDNNFPYFGFIQLNTSSNATYGGLMYTGDCNITIVAQASSKINITEGHTYKLRVKRSKNTFLCYAQNMNDLSEVTWSFDWPIVIPVVHPIINIGRLGFEQFRSAEDMQYDVTSCIINSEAISCPKTAVVTDSIGTGIGISGSITQRYFDLLFGTSYTKYNLMASPGLKIAILDTNKTEILNYKPKYVFMIIGVNDYLTDHSAFQASYESVLDYYIANGIIVVVGHVLPTNNSDIRWMNTILDTICAARSIKVVDTFTPLVSGTYNLSADYDCGDHLHINAAGHTVIANTILAAAPELV